MRAALLFLSVLAGCTQFPELDRAADPAAMAAPYPTLLPAEALPAAGTPPADPAAALLARAAALRARAGELNAAGP